VRAVAQIDEEMLNKREANIDSGGFPGRKAGIHYRIGGASGG
tara:strand:- start:147 stop:272 length:126 start_codon:yes stop_codon:yes gene_type:complete